MKNYNIVYLTEPYQTFFCQGRLELHLTDFGRLRIEFGSDFDCLITANQRVEVSANAYDR